MPEEKKRINAVIDMDLYIKITKKGYGISEAVIKGFEKLLEEPTNTNLQKDSYYHNEELVMSLQNQIKTLEEGLSKAQDTSELEKLQERTEKQKVMIEEYKAQIQIFNVEITRLQKIIMEAPDPIELAKLKERNEGLNLVIAEKEKRIEDLTKYKEDIGAFANYFKSKKTELIEEPATGKVKPWWKFW